MTNFQFLRLEFKPLYEPAKGAEQLVHSAPRWLRSRHQPDRPGVETLLALV